VEEIGGKVSELLHELAPKMLGTEGAVPKGYVGVTNYMIFLLLALTTVAIFFLIAARKAALQPKGIANIGEMGVEFVQNNIVVDVMGEEGKKYLAFVVTVFFAVLFNNFWGLFPGFKPGTGTLGTTLTWGLIVFVVYNAIGFKKNGFFPYLKSFLPSGTPMFLAPFIYLLEVISHFLRPFTLGVRLYANMYAGHIVLGVFAIFVDIAIHNLTPISAIVGTMSLAMQIIMYAFEVFVAFIQAYVFAILTAVYISGALHAKEH